MSLHDSDVTARFSTFLDRKALPRRLEGKQMAQDDEMRALIATILRYAPRSAPALAGWWPLFESALSEACGDYWPSEKHIRPAAEIASKSAPKLRDETGGPDMRPVAIIARKMQRGEAVGEAWLWGRNAVELATSSLIDRDTVARYRSAAFLARKAVYGESDALAWEADAQARHEAAKDVWRHRRDPAAPQAATIPDKSAPYDPNSFAA